MSEATGLRGQVIEDETLISLEELCRNCTVQTEEVITMVREGILDSDAPDRLLEASTRVASIR